MSRVEAKHFVEKYFKHSDDSVKYIDEVIFNEWFKTLDKDGDGKVEIIEMANYMKVLEH